MPSSAPLRLLVSCPDRPGIIAAVARFLHERGANIVRSDQHTSDPRGGTFFLRMEFVLPDERRDLLEAFGLTVAAPYRMTWRVIDSQHRKRIAVLASRADHCLVDLLWRQRRGELAAEITMVASNHADLRSTVEWFGVPFHHVPMPAAGKAAAEAELADLLEGRCDVAVLARYMQILSGAFLDKIGVPVINIHHSFLPSFPGAAPYQRARDRGVKLIGATAHYVTAELDEGPIIEQDVVRASHRDDAAALARLGADVERTVLARAVRWHCEDRLLQHENTVLVF
ncbi:formyltetrahydrofolate deformylase [Amorphoplanes digitatis]|uniref:Formyltetrahydrofolate deformylase n=1 Tax=Actinoplanes digitatis TaxID=1868 RepID=A0A7W7I202_9ACTN|nr:formyltetrahydrofolate deformylase [Actinoplanes digitatis]MBB4764776.1 formyltetrahydrofolate deformylase [Actinoplanes digitatis]BFE74348.1 formyltetrahydrofolate deformylase [Actinoplanes digitatis]GID91271.1 formyltetrahydrofolate deformylase [Actinoplanes digitatis]